MKLHHKFGMPVMALMPVLALAIGLPARASVTLVINEFMADNETIVADPQGEYDDWIEIYNAGTETADLGGMYLTDMQNTDESIAVILFNDNNAPEKVTIQAAGKNTTTLIEADAVQTIVIR